jgi:hypothetical protein
MSKKYNKSHILHEKRSPFVLTFISFLAMFALATLFDVGHVGSPQNVQATSTATTTVRVLNTPPAWTVTAYEYFASATTTPTNSGSTTVWAATASDSNAEDYYLLICKSSSTPIAGTSTAPRCGGGGTDQWAVSGPTTSGTQVQVSTTTQEAWVEKNDWYGYICDGNAGSPRCNGAQYNGLHEGGASATSSPFVVNHRPTLTLAADDSPTLPGATTTWTTTSDDADSLGTDDTIQLHVCKAQDFDPTIPACGAGGFWASSTFALSNVSAQGYITPPAQDRDLPAYVYLVDNNKHPALGGWHSSSTVLTVANATPRVASSTVEVYDVFGTTTSDKTLALTVEEGVTNNFVVRFQVTDDNSCQVFGGGNEITSANINFFRYDGTSPYTRALACDALGEYNANYCYTDTNPYFTPTCYQVPNTCSGATDSTAEWECLFPLWYIADPTDVGSQYAGHDWRASARVTDDDAAISAYATYDQPINGASTEMTQFLSFRATGTPIAYGSLEPGQNNPTHHATTTVYATGNTGLDEYLSGDAMCVSYPSCSGNATSTIYVPYQHYSLANSTLYAAGTALSTSTTPTRVNVVITKTTATSSPTNDDTYWSIAVPSTITFAGDYIGRNYIDAVVAPSGEW